MFTITIDGPSASGKSTVANLVAEKLGVHHLNSGEFYRAIALYMQNKNIDYTDLENIGKNLKNINIEIEFINDKQHVILNNEDVTHLLHSNRINDVVSKFAHNEMVVHKASELTYNATLTQELVLDGRNVGSFVLPNAECKIFLDCDPKIRAERRYLEAKNKGENVNFEDIYKQTLERDELDRTRKIAPMIVPENAYVLKSDNKTPNVIADEIVEYVKSVKN